MSNLHLTIDTLKTSLRDAQRAADELRVEVDARRQELADVQIARAQLEGRIREAERRLTEARHVIDLQREELSSARAEREQAGRGRAALQSQLKQLQRQLSKAGKQVQGKVAPASTAPPRDGQLGLSTIGSQQDVILTALEESAQAVPEFGTSVAGAFLDDEVPMTYGSIELPRVHVIKAGDTLWSIARRYHTSVKRLMVWNALPSERILVEQVLLLTEPSTDESENERM